MSQVYGPITAFAISFLVTMLTQLVKNSLPAATPKMIQLYALGIAVVLIVPYELLSAEKITGLVIYSAIVYSLFGWLTAIGMYEVGSKQLQK